MNSALTDEKLTKLSHYYALALIQFVGNSVTPESFTINDLVLYYSQEDEWGERTSYFYNSRLIERALKTLSDHSIIDRIVDDYGPEVISAKDGYYNRLADLSEQYGPPYTNYARLRQNHSSWLKQAIDKVNLEIIREEHNSENYEEVATDDETWEPISIDRSDEKYLAAIKTTEDAIEAVEQNNGYAATHPEERNGIINSLKGNLSAIKDGSIPKKLVISGIITPLKYLARKFGDNITGEVIKLAIKNLLSWMDLG